MTLYRVELDPVTGLPRGEPEALLVTGGRRRHRRRGCRCRRADLDCALGRRLHRRLQSARRASALAPRCRRGSRAVRPFVGQDFSRLLVTSAWQGMDEATRSAPIPDHGRTFVLDVAARGRPEPDVKLATLMEEDEARTNARERLSFKNRIQRSRQSRNQRSSDIKGVKHD